MHRPVEDKKKKPLRPYRPTPVDGLGDLLLTYTVNHVPTEEEKKRREKDEK